MLLIADSGSTKTKWILQSKDQVMEYIGPGLNPYFVTDEFMSSELENVCEALKGPKPDYIGFYGTGVTDEEKSFRIQHLLNTQFGSENITVKSDIIGAGLSLLGMEKGVACILGTGAASARFEHGEIIEQQPSLGFWLGDEGSGSDLGKELVKAYLRSDLGELQVEFEKEFGVFDRYSVFEKLNQPRPNAWFASFTPFLKRFEQERIMQDILNDRFDLFVSKNLMKYSLDVSQKIGFIGSVAFHFQETLTKVLRQYLDNEVLFEKDPIPGLLRFHS
ncbi:hypothetical protein [Jiulongibacter sediminis]|uniref:N-acetylglucosamine kinase n=1 Tax=Jiulongibacter sediminis TaxID=1605367 RepID=A0A0P7BHZ2_9BACT|nr:hypothetical protein [Jiulongibacter sediminis]KPM46651.1 hypothetical protein AFM12_17855 [Jiulongibacter sediminis]TBX21556.1 hypothetical protein TK44_17860 [Jiulongibacter sediminis]